MHDVQLSILALQRAVDAVREAKADRDRVLGRVLAVTRLLRSDAVLASAVRDLGHDALANDAVRIEQASQTILRHVEQIFYELGDLYLDTGSPWRKIVDAHPNLLARATTQEKLGEVLRRAASPFDRGIAGLDHPDLEPFCSNVAPKLLAAIQQANDPQKLNQVVSHIEQLKDLTEQSRRLLKFRRLCATGSVAGIVARMDRLLTEWDERIAQGPSGPNWGVPDSNNIEDDLFLIASRIETYLAGRRSRRLVLYRAKVYFEHFFCREARDVLMAEEARVTKAKQAGTIAKAQRELELRRYLDRFIFQEGFFPITEASAGRGKLDLLIAGADAARIRPLVVEIKQAARIEDDTVDAKEVEAAIGDARKEIPSYVGHLRARPGWEDIEPLVVVFHTSIENVSHLEDDSTILINIGSRSPSQLVSGS